MAEKKLRRRHAARGWIQIILDHRFAFGEARLSSIRRFHSVEARGTAPIGSVAGLDPLPGCSKFRCAPAQRQAVMSEIQWEHLEHGADIGVRGYGDDPAAAFAQAALAMSAVVTDPQLVESRDTIEVECEAENYDLLLLDWLNEVVYQMATRNMLFGGYEVSIEDHHLEARLHGETVDRVKHQPAVEIKGATMTELAVYRSGDGRWIAQCVIDV